MKTTALQFEEFLSWMLWGAYSPKCSSFMRFRYRDEKGFQAFKLHQIRWN